MRSVRGSGVFAYRRGDDFPRWKRWPVVCRDYPHLVRFVLDYHRNEAVALVDDLGHLLEQRAFGFVEIERQRAFAGQHYELGQVQGVSAFAQNLALWALLATGLQESAHVFKVVGARIRRQGLRWRQRVTVACEDVADLALRDRD